MKQDVLAEDIFELFEHLNLHVGGVIALSLFMSLLGRYMGRCHAQGGFWAFIGFNQFAFFHGRLAFGFFHDGVSLVLAQAAARGLGLFDGLFATG